MATRDLRLEVGVAHHLPAEGGLDNDLTTFFNSDQGEGAPNLLASNSGVLYHCGAGRIVLSIWMGTTGVAAMVGPKAVESKGRTCS